NLYLKRRQPQRELSGIVFQQKANKPLVGAQRGPVNDQRRIGAVVLVGVLQFKTAALGKVNLVGSQRKLAANDAPYLYVDFGAIKSRLIGYLNVGYIRFNKHLAHHFLGFLPQFGFVYVLLTQFGGFMQRQTHYVFFNAEYFEI